MAGPSVAVRIIGDLTSWAQSVSGAADNAQTGSNRIKSAFSSVLGQLNKSGVLGPFSGAIDGVQQAIDQMGEHALTAGQKLIGAGGAIAGIGATLLSIGSPVKEAQQQLQVAIENAGGSWDTYSTQVGEAVKSEEKHGETAATTMNALQTLTQATHDPALALKELGAASDLAAAKHEDLGSAATQLAKVYSGQGTRTLKAFGITVKESGTKALEDLSKVTKGQAEASANSLNGRMRALRATVMDAVSSFANKYGPAITAAGGIMTGFGATLEIVKGLQEAGTLAKIGETVATTAQSAATGIATAAQWAFNAAMNANPIGIVVLAIAALVAGFVLAYQHITVFRNAVQDVWKALKEAFDAVAGVVKDAIDWLKSNWPDVVLAILAGPFGLVLGVILTHWSAVEEWLKALPAKIAGFFTDVGTWLLNTGKQLFDGFAQGIQNAAQAVWTWFAGLGAKILSFIVNAGQWLYGIGSAVFTGFAQGVEGAAQAVWTWFGNLGAKVVSLIVKAGEWLYSTGSSIITGLAKGIVDTVQSVWTWFSGLSGKITGLLSKPWNWLYQVGRDIVGGLFRGVREAWDSAIHGVTSLFSGIVDIAKKAVGAHSPSTMFADIGRDTIQGFVNGVNQMAPVASSAVNNALTGDFGVATSSGATATTGAIPSAGAGAVIMQNVSISKDVDIDLVAQKLTAALTAGRV